MLMHYNRTGALAGVGIGVAGLAVIVAIVRFLKSRPPVPGVLKFGLHRRGPSHKISPYPTQTGRIWNESL
jgi:hypothetical protein